MERHVDKSQASDKLSYSANDVILFYIDLRIIIIMTSYNLYMYILSLNSLRCSSKSKL